MTEEPDVWMVDAACGGCADPDVFYSEDRGVTTLPSWRAVDAAGFYCRECPVVRECDAFATANGYPGLWGGVWRVHDEVTGEYRAIPIVRTEAA